MKPSMKLRLITLTSALLLLTGHAATAQIDYILNDTTISAPVSEDVWVGRDDANHETSPTVKVVKGAEIPYLEAFNGSRVLMSGGLAGPMLAHGNSLIVINGSAFVEGNAGTDEGQIILNGGTIDGWLIASSRTLYGQGGSVALLSGHVKDTMQANFLGHASMSGGDSPGFFASDGGSGYFSGGEVGILACGGVSSVASISTMVMTGGLVTSDVGAYALGDISITAGTVKARLFSKDGGKIHIYGGQIDDPSDGWYLYRFGEMDVHGYGLGTTLLNPDVTFTDPDYYGTWSEYAWHGHLADGNSLEGKHLFVQNGGQPSLELFSVPAAVPEPGPIAIFAAVSIGFGLTARRRRQAM